MAQSDPKRARARRAIRAVESELQKRGWTQSDLARAMGTSSGTVNRWLTGERTPDLAMALKLEEVLAVPVRLWAEEAA